MKEVYILATEERTPLAYEALEQGFEAEEVQFNSPDAPWGFTLLSEGSKVEVSFEEREAPMGWTPELITGSEQAHALLRRARGFYRFRISAGQQPQPSVGVFEALWCARALMEGVGGVLLDVTAFKLHDSDDVEEITELDFDIRDHVNLHAVEVIEGDTPLWVHSHGMEKFGQRDIEVFHLSEDDLPAAESFLHELCTDLAFGHSAGPRIPIETSSGASFMFVPSEQARTTLMGVPLESFEGHEGLFFTVVAPDGRHTSSELLRPYRDRFQGEKSERSEALQALVHQLLPAFKARFNRKGLMEPLTFLVRAAFETHPEGKADHENLWVEIVHWDDGKLVGKLIEGAVQTTEWRKGAHVEVEEPEINALALHREGRPLDEAELRELLEAELPS